MTAIFAEHVLQGDVLETRNSETQYDHDMLYVETVLTTPWGLMFQGHEYWSNRLVTTLPVPATSLVEVQAR